MKTMPLIIGLVAILLISSTSGALVSQAFAPETNYYPQHSPFPVGGPQRLSLGIQGIIADAGNQSWAIKDGILVGAQLGQESVPGGSIFDYSFSANVVGLSASGELELMLGGTSLDGQSINLAADGIVVGMIPSICFPSYQPPDSNGNCQSTDRSAIPALFEVASFVNETLGAITTHSQTLLLVEAPILNPFGGPIVISSIDGSMSIVTTYKHATATWRNVELIGTLDGVVTDGENGNSQLHAVDGMFNQTVNANENFVSGIEEERGSLSFVGMSPSYLDMKGFFRGFSEVPKDGGIDCSVALGLPEGTCVETGLHSAGIFTLEGFGSHEPPLFPENGLSGIYVVDWPAPSIYYGGTMQAALNWH